MDTRSSSPKWILFCLDKKKRDVGIINFILQFVGGLRFEDVFWGRSINKSCSKLQILISTIFWAMIMQIRQCLLILLCCKIGVKHLKSSNGKQARMQWYRQKVRWNWWGWKNLRDWSCFTWIGYQFWWCASFDSVCYQIEVKLNVYLKRRI